MSNAQTPESREETVHLTPEEARAGEKTGHVRIILAVSLTVAVLALVIVAAFAV